MTHSVVAVVGLSHLGLVNAAGFSELGYRVIACNPNGARGRAIFDRRELPVFEPGLAEMLEQNRSRITFTAAPEALAEADLVLFAEDVPTNDQNVRDLTSLRTLINWARPNLRDGATAVIMSQVPPGFTREVSVSFSGPLEPRNISVVYWAETLIFGSAIQRFFEPDLLLIGSSEPSAPLPEMLRGALDQIRAPLFVVRFESAELAKAAINIYLIQSVTYANAMADLCEISGASWAEVMPVLKRDQRIGHKAYLTPSLGVSGGNLERDLVGLREAAAASGERSALLDALSDCNDRRFQWVLRQLDEHVFSTTKHPTLAIWGLTYKKNTRSTKNSPSLRLISCVAGKAVLKAWDPLVQKGELEIPAEVSDSAFDALQGADALIVMNDCDEFAALPIGDIRAKTVIDCTSVLRPRATELSGSRYVCMGEPCWASGAP